MSPAVPSTASSLQRAAAVALRILFCLGTDAVICTFLLTFWAGCFGGLVLTVFGIRVGGEGSAAEAFGAALQLRAFGLLQRLFPVFVPLYLVRLLQRAWVLTQPPAKEDYTRKKPSGLGIVIAALANGQYHTLLGENFFFKDGQLPPYAAIPFLYALLRNITIQLNLERKSLVWRVGFIFCDVATLGFLFIAHLLLVRDLALLATIPRARSVSVMHFNLIYTNDKPVLVSWKPTE